MEELARVVREVLVASDHVRQTTAAALGVGVNEFAVLSHLLHHGTQTPSLIAARVGLTPTGTTALIDRMERVRLVRRSPHPGDRRRVDVTLSSLGRDAVTALYTASARDIARALDRGLDGADPRLRDDGVLRTALTAVLGEVAAVLRERAGDPIGVEAALAAPADAGTATGVGPTGPPGAPS